MNDQSPATSEVSRLQLPTANQVVPGGLVGVVTLDLTVARGCTNAGHALSTNDQRISGLLALRKVVLEG